MLLLDGKAEYLPGKGKPVGIFEDATWHVYETVLPENASLVVFSDGVLEILPDKGLIAQEQLLLKLLLGTEGRLASIEDRLGLADLHEIPDDIAILTLNLGALE